MDVVCNVIPNHQQYVGPLRVVSQAASKHSVRSKKGKETYLTSLGTLNEGGLGGVKTRLRNLRTIFQKSEDGNLLFV